MKKLIFLLLLPTALFSQTQIVIEFEFDGYADETSWDILDTNGDGKISLEDFDDLFCSYGGAKMNPEIWE